MSRQNPTPPQQQSPCGLPSQDSSKSFWHSEPSPLLLGHRSTRHLPKSADVVIIGSGITGASVAHHLLNDNSAAEKPNVVMLEAREACWGATGRNGGHCQPLLFEHPSKPEIGRFELANFYALGKLVTDKQIDCEFVAQPGVRAIYSEAQVKIAQDALGIMKTTAPDLAAMMRFTTSEKELAELRIPTALGALITDVAARMWPYKFVAHILGELLTSVDLQGRFNLQTLTPATGISPHTTGVEVHTARGTISASRVVLATNAYTSHLLPSFADLIVPRRGQMSSLIPFPSIADDNRLKTSLGFLGDGLDDYLVQRPSERGGHLMFGGGEQHEQSFGVTDDSVVDPETAHYLQSRLIEACRLPEGDAAPVSMEATHMWSGIMGFSRDDLPWVGKVPETSHTYIAAGFNGHGMPNTWLSGKVAAVLVSKSLQNVSDAEAIRDAQSTTGLPDGYIVTKERIEAALTRQRLERKNCGELRTDQQDVASSAHADKEKVCATNNVKLSVVDGNSPLYAFLDSSKLAEDARANLANSKQASMPAPPPTCAIMPRSPQHTFTNISATENAQQHNGNVYTALQVTTAVAGGGSGGCRPAIEVKPGTWVVPEHAEKWRKRIAEEGEQAWDEKRARQIEAFLAANPTGVPSAEYMRQVKISQGLE